MKSRIPLWIAVVCLLSAAVITIGLKTRSAVHAATSAQSSHAMSVKSVAPLSDAALHAALAPQAVLDTDGAMRVTGTQAPRTIFPPVQEFTLTPPNPATGLTKTVFSVRFPQTQAASMPSTIPMTLANQKVVLQRSPDEPGTFLTALNFDWKLFAEEQAERKSAASQGKMVPIFEGRKYRGRERMQFVEPEEIQQALESHQPLQFSSHALVGSAGFNVFPDHQLMMTNKLVVEDVGDGTPQHPARTFDQCINDGPQGNPNGAWTFNTLMTAIACSGNSNCTNSQTSQQIAEQMLLGMLNNFAQDQHVNNNNFTVLARPNMGQLAGFNGGQGSGLLKNWPVDSNAGNSCTFNGQSSPCPSLPSAPARLDAIVNRIDLEANGAPFAPAGELRFVFSVSASPIGSGACSNGGTRRETFNIILEYRVPDTISTLSWAQRWANLPDLNAGQTFSENYLSALQTTITNAVVAKNACNNGTASCISQVRTNEFLIASGVNVLFWELREFHLGNVGGAPVLSEAMIAQTPDPQFNNDQAQPSGQPPCSSVNNDLCTRGIVGEYINSVANNPTFQQTHGAAPPVPQNFPDGSAFLGGSSLNEDPNAPSFWNDTGINPGNGTARIDFSFNTCNGCHGKETQTTFVQVSNRVFHASSALSNFLLGNPQCPIQTENLGATSGLCRESVTDPVGLAGPTLFGDVARRVLFLQTVCGNSPTCTPGGASNELLFPFINNPIGVH